MKLAQHVLLIDDNPDCNFIMREFIRMVDAEIQVTSLESSMDGLQWLAQTSVIPDVVFVDINMPIIDGFGFLQAFQDRFRLQFPETRVFMLSSSVREEDVNRAKASQVVSGFISKSYIDDHLKEALTVSVAADF
jgi:CheY-like chemotaxis protein